MSRQFTFVRRITLLLGAGIVLASCSPSSKLELGPPVDDRPVEFSVDESFFELNRTRQRFFLAGFQQDARLMEAAQRHANLMGSTGKFGHEFGPSTKFKTRIFSVGFDNSAGENIGVGYRSIQAAIKGWLDSPGHRKILLKKRYTLGGIAYAPNTSGKNPRLNHFWVLIVGAE